jgi:pimeloyl-ACP methyl ester carboxylesterase
MPINMAVFDSDAADGIMAEFPGIKNWAIAGHSVGGVAAAIYTGNQPERIDGLAIWASFPPDSADLAKFAIPVYLIYGELDPAANAADVESRTELLPEDTVYVEIKGGDHHQFGTYLIKPENDLATISRENQQKQIILATLELLGAIAKGTD